MIQRLQRAWHAFWNTPEPLPIEDVEPEPKKIEKEKEPEAPPLPPNKAERWRDLLSKRPKTRIGRNLQLRMDDGGNLIIKRYYWNGHAEQILLLSEHIDDTIRFMVEHYGRSPYGEFSL